MEELDGFARFNASLLADAQMNRRMRTEILGADRT
jgi:hypothetical protein